MKEFTEEQKRFIETEVRLRVEVKMQDFERCVKTRISHSEIKSFDMILSGHVSEGSRLHEKVEGMKEVFSAFKKEQEMAFPLEDGDFAIIHEKRRLRDDFLDRITDCLDRKFRGSKGYSGRDRFEIIRFISGQIELAQHI